MRSKITFSADKEVMDRVEARSIAGNRTISNTIESLLKKALGIKNNPKTKKASTKEHPRFQEFWSLYDKKQDTARCKAKFSRLSESDIELIFKVLPLYVASTPEKTFRKNPMTWLNGECWNDEIQAPLLPPKSPIESAIQQSSASNWHEEDLGL